MQSSPLSQAEIDALLSNLGQPEARDKKEAKDGNESVATSGKSVRPYDFRRPDKFSKEQIRALQMLHETFARLMSSSLSARLRSLVQARLASIDQGVYSEFLRQIPGSTILGIIGMEPLPGSMILEISPNIAGAMIDRLLGGPGRSPKRPATVTDIELALLKGLLGTLSQDLEDTWRNIIQVSPQLKDIILNPRFIQLAFQGDAVVILVFEVKLADTIGTITICIPYTVLEPIVPKLSAQSWFMASRRSALANAADNLRREIQKMTIPVSVVLGSTDVDIEDLLAIQVGDIIRLDSRVGHELDVTVGGRVKYLAVPGRVGSRVAARVTAVVADGAPASTGESKAP